VAVEPESFLDIGAESGKGNPLPSLLPFEWELPIFWFSSDAAGDLALPLAFDDFELASPGLAIAFDLTNSASSKATG